MKEKYINFNECFERLNYLHANGICEHCVYVGERSMVMTEKGIKEFS